MIILREAVRGIQCEERRENGEQKNSFRKTASQHFCYLLQNLIEKERQLQEVLFCNRLLMYILGQANDLKIYTLPTLFQMFLNDILWVEVTHVNLQVQESKPF